MTKARGSAPLNRADLTEAFRTFDQEVLTPKLREQQTYVDQGFTSMQAYMDQGFASMHKYVDSSVSHAVHELKDYIDTKLADYTSDIFKRLEQRFQRDREFKHHVVKLLRKHRIGTAEEVAFLEGLAG